MISMMAFWAYVVLALFQSGCPSRIAVNPIVLIVRAMVIKESVVVQWPVGCGMGLPVDVLRLLTMRDLLS
jgi:hypothetical protein